MLEFNIVRLGRFYFRCVFGEETYCDFYVNQLELFDYTHIKSLLRYCVGKPVYEIVSDRLCGECISVKYIEEDKELWVLIRNGINGEFYKKELE